MTTKLNIKKVNFTKRIFDITLIIPSLIALIPVIIFIAVLVRFKIGTPVLFVQKRTGFKGNPFRIIKFRTMKNSTDEKGNLLPDRERLLDFGKSLRDTSLDELPEILNVLRGEMSLVGPRPLLTEYLDRYTDEQARRHEMRPGITGWAQINGRNDLSWEDKFKLDIWYIDNWSFGLDIRILALTAVKIFRREGITQPGHATADKFRGTVIKNGK